MTLATLRGVGTLLALLAFLAVVLWAYGRWPRREFDEAAALPLEEDRL
jgi:cytochrome c oxidase cbb3-type subunit 4